MAVAGARAMIGSLQGSRAARISHAPRALTLMGQEWKPGEYPDFTTTAARVHFRELVATARSRGEIDDKAAATLLRAVDGAARDDQAKPNRLPAPPVIVGLQDFGARNGHAEA